MSILFLPILAAIAAPAGSATDDELQKLIQESNVCLSREVERQLPDGKTQVSDGEQSAIRMAAASKCNAYAQRMSLFTDEYRNGTKSLEQVEEDMLVVSLRIADALVSTRVKSSAEKANH